jgi:DNA-binding NarL/FixJ family response regulator
VSSSEAVKQGNAADAADIVVIEGRMFVRECLSRCFQVAFKNNVNSFPNVASWLNVSEITPAWLIILSTGIKSKDEVNRCVSLLSRSTNCPPMILLSDAEEPDHIVDALERGARGYIPSSVSLDVAVQAMRLVGAGGIFMPADCLMAARRDFKQGKDVLTARQEAVVEALRRGKPNKIIAHELNMRESTVKVHVRNIMKKLKARNRTQVAFMVNQQMTCD